MDIAQITQVIALVFLNVSCRPPACTDHGGIWCDNEQVCGTRPDRLVHVVRHPTGTEFDFNQHAKATEFEPQVRRADSMTQEPFHRDSDALLAQNLRELKYHGVVRIISAPHSFGSRDVRCSLGSYVLERLEFTFTNALARATVCLPISEGCSVIAVRPLTDVANECSVM